MEQTLSPAYLRSVVRRRLLVFLLPVLALLVAITAIVMSLPAIYTSQATILVETQQIPADLVPSTITALASERLQVIQQRITARDNILALAKQYKLLANKPYTTSELVDEVRSRIKITQTDLRIAGQTGRERVAMIFKVAYQDESPETATKVANELVTNILQEDVKTRAALASETSRFLDRETKRLSAELTDVEAQISKFRVENADMLPERLTFNVAELEKAQRELVDIDREMLSIEDSRRFVEFEQSIRGTSPDGKAPPGSLADIELRIEQLKAEIATLSGSYSEKHPEMRTRRKALEALMSQRDEATKNPNLAKDENDVAAAEALSVQERVNAEKIKSLDARVAFLKAQKEKLKTATDDIRGMIRRTPEVGAILGELERRQGSLRRSLDEMGEKLAQAKLAERLEQDQQAERFEVIEQPVRPQKPSAPNRSRLIGLGGFLSVALGGALVYALEMFDDTVRTSAGFQAKTGLRPIAVIPYITQSAEVRRRRWKIFGAIVLAILAFSVALAGLHFFVRPLDQILSRVLQLARDIL